MVLEVLVDFKNRFRRLSVRDRIILVLDKVVMFLKVVDVRDRKDLGVLLVDTTTEGGLTNT